MARGEGRRGDETGGEWEGGGEKVAVRARGRVGIAPLVAAAKLVHRRLAKALALARHHHGEARA